MIPQYSIETAYSFLHQKMQVFIHSKMDWQQDDIEMAISSYSDDMNQELYEKISGGRPDYLRTHEHFKEDIVDAVSKLEELLLKS